MQAPVPPLPYLEWRSEGIDRHEDAAHVFGYYLVKHCRNEALARLPEDQSEEARAAAVKAVDSALHSVCDMLQGFYSLTAGPDHRVTLALSVQVRNAESQIVESLEICPNKLDLPIGYWQWVDDHAHA